MQRPVDRRPSWGAERDGLRYERGRHSWRPVARVRFLNQTGRNLGMAGVGIKPTAGGRELGLKSK